MQKTNLDRWLSFRFKNSPDLLYRLLLLLHCMATFTTKMFWQSMIEVNSYNSMIANNWEHHAHKLLGSIMLSNRLGAS